MKDKKENIKFEIDQLRKDKMIYALESISTTLAMLMLSILSSFFVTPGLWVILLALSVSLGYWVFTVWGNTKRLTRIRELEKKL